MSAEHVPEGLGAPEEPLERRLQAALESARHFMTAERYDLAERQARAALALDPDNVEGHVTLGRVLRHLGRHEEAEADCRAALALDPDSVEGLQLLADFCLDTQREKEALAALDRALALDPEDVRTLLYLGLTHSALHDSARAEHYLRRALELDPNQSVAHGLLASVYIGRGKVAQARHHAEIALRLNPDEPAAHFTAGSFAYLGGDPFRARELLREALRREPTNEDAREAYGKAEWATRWYFRPAYHWRLWTMRLPGEHYAGMLLMLVAFWLAARLCPDTISRVVVWAIALAVTSYLWTSLALRKRVLERMEDSPADEVQED